MKIKWNEFVKLYNEAKAFSIGYILRWQEKPLSLNKSLRIAKRKGEYLKPLNKRGEVVFRPEDNQIIATYISSKDIVFKLKATNRKVYGITLLCS